jgi:hypothetical protein
MSTLSLTQTAMLLLGLIYPYTLISLTTANAAVAETYILPSLIKRDILFLVDATPNMCQYSKAIASGISDFVSQLSENNIDAIFAVASFGGTPVILQGFSVSSSFPLTFPQSNGTITRDSINDVGCAAFGQEAGLEAIRMALDGKGGMNLGCADVFDCELRWRDDSKRVIIMITDEDSDLPTNA